MVKEIIHNLNAFKPVFIGGAINNVCFLLAAFVPGVWVRSIQKRNGFRKPVENARKFSTIFCWYRQKVSIDKII